MPSTLQALLAALSLACASPSSTGEPAGAGLRQETAEEQDTLQDEGVFDLDRVFELSRKLRLPSGRFSGWLPGEDAYLATGGFATGDGELKRVDLASGSASSYFDREKALAAWSALPGVDDDLAEQLADRTQRALSSGKEAALLNSKNDLFHYRLGADAAARLTHDPLEEVGETLSPDGSLVAYISDWNLHVVPATGGEPRALTADGDENHLYGRLDWVYQEELYGRGNFQGFWWSPDSRRLAFLILDESPVPEYTIPDHRKNRPDVEVWRYPKAGDPNPKATLAVVDVAGGDFRLMDLSRYATQEFLIVRCGWTPDSSEVILQVQDRIQTWLDVVAADPDSGDTRVLFRERTGVWVEPTGAPYWIEVPDGDDADDTADQFLWLSERDGWKHLYRYDLEGNLIGRLTKGHWEVDTYHGYDADTETVYFSGDKADVKGQQLFRVGLDGSELTQITAEPGTHRVNVSPDFEHYTDSFSSHQVAPRLTLNRIDGTAVRTLAQVDAKVVADANLITPEFHKVKTRDGFEMEASLVKPRDFDPARKYPVLSYTYSGPHASQVRDSFFNFNALFHQMFAREGYLIWICDNRSASGKGLESVKPVYKNLGPLELRDLEDGIAWLVDQGFADPERVGLWGWSYGGFMTAFALTHSDVFKVGVIGAPVTDWRLYDTIYTERYMDTPQANPEGYDRTSVVKAAADFQGKALIVHGVIDENVHMQNSLQLANALQNAGHLFELMLYPGNRHGIVRPDQRRHLYTMMADFFRRNL